MNPALLKHLSTTLEQKHNATSLDRAVPVSGGDINQCYSLYTKTKDQSIFFVKVNQAHYREMFQAEASALTQLAASSTLLTPKVICYDSFQKYSYLVLSYHQLHAHTSQSARLFGKQLAQLHQYKRERSIGSEDYGYQAFGFENYGFQENNFIGLTPQPNNWQDNWADFFAEQRIGFQLQTLQQKGQTLVDINNAIKKTQALLSNHQPQASLLHGDLWSGNQAMTDDGPITYDPASYWGDRECDLAMTELFGGFPDEFYQGYADTWALDENYEKRRNLYNLYHILNHANLFGGTYIQQAKTSIKNLGLS